MHFRPGKADDFLCPPGEPQTIPEPAFAARDSDVAALNAGHEHLSIQRIGRHDQTLTRRHRRVCVAVEWGVKVQGCRSVRRLAEETLWPLRSRSEERNEQETCRKLSHGRSAFASLSRCVTLSL